VNRPAYVDSYYAATAHPAPVRPPLQGAVDCDVCVVGGGIAGCSAALHLAERGYRVVLLEAQRIGWGASGRSGAQVLPGIAAGQEKLERLIGPDDARRVWDVTVEGIALMRELVARHAIDCDWVDGQMQVAGAGGTAQNARMRTARNRASCTLLQTGEVLIFGGLSDTTNATAKAEIYSPKR